MAGYSLPHPPFDENGNPALDRLYCRRCRNWRAEKHFSKREDGEFYATCDDCRAYKRAHREKPQNGETKRSDAVRAANKPTDDWLYAALQADPYAAIAKPHEKCAYPTGYAISQPGLR